MGVTARDGFQSTTVRGGLSDRRGSQRGGPSGRVRVDASDDSPIKILAKRTFSPLIMPFNARLVSAHTSVDAYKGALKGRERTDFGR